MSETYFTVISYRTRNTECLKSDTDSLGSFSSVLAAFLQCDGCSYYISPFGILEADRLRVFASLIRIKTILLAWLSNLTSLIIIVFLLILYVGQCI